MLGRRTFRLTNTLWEPIMFVSRGITVLKNNGVKLNLSKCELAKNEVTFLGYKTSKQGSQPDPKNVEAVLEMKRPTKVKEVRQF